MEKDYKNDSFEEYIREKEAKQKDRGYAWYTAIGLQAVDGLKNSSYLLDTAKKNIDGEISIGEAKTLIDNYYREKPQLDNGRTEEADKVAVRIAEILSEKAFTFSVTQYVSIHQKLFQGIYSHAGKIRDYNITKSEWVLDGDTVHYGGASELRATIEYDLSLEKNFSYRGLSMDEVITHLSRFTANLWQIHIFGEGNTRTTAVFLIKYLRTLGFDVTNSIFAENAWYFRNALVRANYNDLVKGIYETTEFLELFFQNLLLGENNVLSNRAMHISGNWTMKPSIQEKKPSIQEKKPNIQEKKPSIQEKKPNIQEGKPNLYDKNKINNLLKEYLPKTQVHIIKLYDEFFNSEFFTRREIEDTLEIKSSAAYELTKKMLSIGILEIVRGHGKGKYRFKERI